MKLLTAAELEVTEESIIDLELAHKTRWSDLKSPRTFGDVKLKPFKKFYQKITEREMGKEDIVVPFADIKFVDEMGAVDIRSYGRVLMTELAFSQLCTRLRIPGDYMMRCPITLRNANLSYWVEQNDERKVMLRIRKFSDAEQDKEGIGVLRAVLPQTYEPIDNERILDWIGTAIDHFNGALGLQYSRVGEVSTHVRLIFDKQLTLHSDGSSEPFLFGVHVSDSEVGERGFAADLVSFRAAHEIGFLHLVEGAHLVAQRHIYIDFKLLRKNFAESFDMVRENQETVVELLLSAQDTPIKDPHSYIRRLIRHHRLTNDFAETVIYAYEAEPQPTKFGVAVALARASKRMPIDMRVDTEALVGGYLLEGA